MKVKTMEKEIQRVFDAWVETIKDKKVQELVKRNTLLAGGSIASMFLQQDVNDFDFYFRTEETAKAVCEYYLIENKKEATVNAKDGRVSLFIPSSGIINIKPDTIDLNLSGI